MSGIGIVKFPPFKYFFIVILAFLGMSKKPNILVLLHKFSLKLK